MITYISSTHFSILLERLEHDMDEGIGRTKISF